MNRNNATQFVEPTKIISLKSNTKKVQIRLQTALAVTLALASIIGAKCFCLRNMWLFFVFRRGFGLFNRNRLGNKFGLQLHRPESISFWVEYHFFHPGGSRQRAGS